MQVYTELVAPSAVTHSLSLPLTSASANNLVVAKGSVLQIFALRSIPAELDPQTQGPQSSVKEDDIHFDRRINDDDGLESSFLGGESLIVRADPSNNTKLVLITEISLAGTVIGLARVRVKDTTSGGEALLLAYKAAKMCLTEWDPQRHTLETTSIHYYEKEDLQGAPWEMPFGDYVNYLEADPGSRCVAFKFGSRNLAILPFIQNQEDQMDGWDEDLDGPRPAKEAPTTNGDGAGDHDVVKSRYTPSFVLRLPLLDPLLLHPVHLAFLYEYREPTFGILSSTQSPSPALGVKDHLTYKVFTLDLHQRASTTILSVTGLPQDLFRVMALPAPMGGALLVGENELLHIDQSGKPNGVAVNGMAKQMTSFSLVDQSDLGLRLEGCAIELLGGDIGELLLILNDGRLAVICFRIDGRTVSGITIKLISPECGGSLIKSQVSCISRLGNHTLFLGSESNDSIVLGWSRKQGQEKRRKSRLLDPELALDVDDLDLDDDEDDDLYGNNSGLAKPSQSINGNSKPGEVTFRVHDTLLSIAPIRDIACGAPAFVPDSEEATLSKGVTAELELACAVGRGSSGSVAILNREIQPEVIGRFDFPEARGFWTMCVKKPLSKGAAVASDYDTTGQYDKYMIVAKVDLDGYETSDVYALTAAGFETLKDTEFEPAAGFTVEAGTMGKQMRVIQVLKSEVRCYDGDLGLSQILPMLDEDTGAEPRVTSASIVDPYLLLIRDDSSIFLAQMHSNNELEEVLKPDGTLKSTKWTSGCLYNDTQGVFQNNASEQQSDEADRIMMFLLSSAGALHVYALPDLSKPVFVAEALTSIPPFLSAAFVARKGASKESVTEILVADLGDAISQTPYLIVRHASDDLTIYEPVRHQAEGGAELSCSLLFKKSVNTSLAKTAPEVSEDDAELPRIVPLRRCANVNGYGAVFLPNASPSFVLKSSKSEPRVIGLQGLGVRGMSTFHTEGCDRGFIYVDMDGIARVTQLPSNTNVTELGLSVKKIALHSDVGMISHHHPTGTYVVACTRMEPFELPRDDDHHKEWAKETASFPPTMARGILKLINAVTWTVIHELELEPCESIESMKTLCLEVSEETKERKMLVAVGTALSKGEDLPTRGRVQVFDIVTVIPEPGRPETNKRLKLIAKEEIPRGGVTALSEVGAQGLMLVAQGQKCMVRGLKEDGSLLPVAFLDMSCHVSSLKELPGTGLCVMADAFKGLWFAGYTEEPYTFKILGKSSGKLPLLVADFLPDGEDLSIVAVDAEGDMHMLEFNPEHPKSLQGHLLLHRTSFAVTPNAPTSSLLLPRTHSPWCANASQPSHVLLLACPSGQLAALSPVAESTYRRLLSVTNQLHPAVVPHCGLHTKAHRYPDQPSVGVGVETAASSGRALVDGTVLARWSELGAAKRTDVALRGGYDSVADLRDDLEGVLGWSALAYL
ncbi:Cleavage factor two protein 1 [Metarhizium album ARSEF 1941]|uniref:Cleavage factor two protein 1 n=1 Tax=Metarhizium album (strain ARSEF 1941) TaxID=1081103 RepID=A0A0B2WM56_METAS|nr:Cleavage factor two protein 1 [Metarhizium album ARSEF 1941]KHN94577.1 Cleavage factor two protein 1 [Metarhizium album ARSEF 1941]